METKEIKELLALIDQLNAVEVELELEGAKLKVKKRLEGELEPRPVATSLAPSVPPPTSSVREEQTDEVLDQNVVEVESPMVGTFYRAPSPDSQPFVAERGRVEKGQTLCIIEAMKLMNELESEYSGTIQKVLVENAQPVEYGQPLFLIKLD